VEGTIGSTNATTYAFNVHKVTDETASLVLGTRVDGSPGIPGQRDAYTFTLAAETRVSFDSLTNGGPAWSLVGPRGTIFSGRLFTRSDSRSGNSVVVLPAGAYTLTVADQGPAISQFASTVQSFSTQFSAPA